ncbi:MAG: glycerol-3-phosphate dehydrogenase/oxidase [Candidatus Omnitrophica bacterium]|nr:glycerol-3-phosphate dehydrogenase/oxidase [Candidatus Omnitrophota bacterium]
MRFDLLIVGGGISGAGIARDASLRSIRALLLDKGDFGSGTSCRTTKLVHGGLRYLEHGQFSLVRQCLAERQTLLRIAPHLVRPLPFLVPLGPSLRRPTWMVRTGVTLYKILAGQNRIDSPPHLSQSELTTKIPLLSGQGFGGAASYADAQMDDYRLCLENVLSSLRQGALALNHVEAFKAHRETKGWRIQVRDCLTGEQAEIHTRCVINATGPWSDRTEQALLQSTKNEIEPTRGAHLLLSKQISDSALLFLSSDHRVIFLIPWRDGTLVGTTEDPFKGDLDSLETEEREIRFLLNEVQRQMGPESVRLEDVAGSFVGVRPLVGSLQNRSAFVSRDHHLQLSAPAWLRVTGGKYTTYRLMAQQAVDIIEKELRGRISPCKTAELPLQESSESGQSIEQRVQTAVRAEAARTVSDVFRRMGHGLLLPSAELQNTILNTASTALGLSADSTGQQMEEYRNALARQSRALERLKEREL